MCYHINHSRLLDAILHFCDIDTVMWSAVKQTISKLHTGEWTWGKVRHELRGPPIAVPATALDELERFDFRDSLDKAIQRLRTILKDTTNLEPIFAHMHAVTKYLARLNVRRKFYISPLSSYNEMFYRGNLLFQCLYDQKRRSVFAAGGRYDQLVRDHQPITSRKVHVHAVGFQLAWTGLCADMMAYLHKSSKTKARRKSLASLNAMWRKQNRDVLIESFDQDLLASAGVDILQQLWASDISAQLAENNAEDAADNMYTKVQEPLEDYTWIILIKSEEFLRVRNTLREDETEVRITELDAYMRYVYGPLFPSFYPVLGRHLIIKRVPTRFITQEFPYLATHRLSLSPPLTTRTPTLALYVLTRYRLLLASFLHITMSSHKCLQKVILTRHFHAGTRSASVTAKKSVQ